MSALDDANGLKERANRYGMEVEAILLLAAEVALLRHSIDRCAPPPAIIEKARATLKQEAE